MFCLVSLLTLKTNIFLKIYKDWYAYCFCIGLIIRLHKFNDAQLERVVGLGVSQVRSNTNKHDDFVCGKWHVVHENKNEEVACRLVRFWSSWNPWSFKQPSSVGLGLFSIFPSCVRLVRNIFCTIDHWSLYLFPPSWICDSMDNGLLLGAQYVGNIILIVVWLGLLFSFPLLP